ncbi:MAG: bifunctional phosphoribosylaminoimidazolecarboxamide formyltransferase/inosine monophosphate cyclohydrolase [Candidatus Magasanikbacteria bacterium CG10_big_fil_rev_8_21_14_0_10_47_10]|uniref:Bifunctional purine biosynthesis protein PurH n=1 Tax=Candidatus Magasanikbacteria bacterium CG10_big_fil_rev_8_21_14_0_10_47_10 TaxID=1974652 RepID=A0A2H0TPR4_9BACT|nr:MAG: bifunctional phosphoribosylaminoimidazolecarboxamide formyltransferase/inosine monophosphate cyclohydrolase [Candidatus Magasanikbacteria bacterium CG10_big_fil_rev_8_21_14_0_10_47_10]
MNTNSTHVRRALISVSDKTDIVDLAHELHHLGVELLSTGGTASTIRDAKIPVTDVSEVTQFPEMMHGRVKTLHPLIHGGILGLRDEHAREAAANNVEWIDLVVCNLYPFAETIKKTDVTMDDVFENIDIGGPSMIRSAAKNVGWTTVLVDPADYARVLDELRERGSISFDVRKDLSAKAFRHTAHYDAIVAEHMNERLNIPFPEDLTFTAHKAYDLRYGENPHQEAAVYVDPHFKETSILKATIHQGKQLSYNNIGDADGALSMVKEFSEPACIVVKHANPCGAAVGTDISDVFQRAYAVDPMSAFGGIIAINRPCTVDIANEIIKVYAEIVIAPCFEPEALGVLAKKNNMRVLEVGAIVPRRPKHELKYVEGGILVQDVDTKRIEKDDLQFVTQAEPTQAQLSDMLFAWKVLKHVKSNGILLAKDSTTVGLGAGQVSRVDAVELAIKKSRFHFPSVNSAGQASEPQLTGCILASDAFFPFRDSIDRAAEVGIKAIIQPGGSMRDDEVIKACDEHGIAMVFTGARCFKH